MPEPDAAWPARLFAFRMAPNIAVQHRPRRHGVLGERRALARLGRVLDACLIWQLLGDGVRWARGENTSGQQHNDITDVTV
jgi:hypothetical protein